MTTRLSNVEVDAARADVAIWTRALAEAEAELAGVEDDIEDWEFRALRVRVEEAEGELARANEALRGGVTRCG